MSGFRKSVVAGSILSLVSAHVELFLLRAARTGHSTLLAIRQKRTIVDDKGSIMIWGVYPSPLGGSILPVNASYFSEENLWKEREERRENLRETDPMAFAMLEMDDSYLDVEEERSRTLQSFENLERLNMVCFAFDVEEMKRRNIQMKQSAKDEEEEMEMDKKRIERIPFMKGKGTLSVFAGYCSSVVFMR